MKVVFRKGDDVQFVEMQDLPEVWRVPRVHVPNTFLFNHPSLAEADEFKHDLYYKVKFCTPGGHTWVEYVAECVTSIEVVGMDGSLLHKLQHAMKYIEKLEKEIEGRDQLLEVAGRILDARERRGE